MSSTLRYLYLKLFFTLIRSISGLRQWLSVGEQKIHGGVAYKRILVPSRDSRRDIKVDLYIPPGYDPLKQQRKVPVLINFHGSGFVLPSLGTDREFCSYIALKCNVVVFDSDYRKAPEHPFPSAPNDVEDIFTYVSAHSDQYDASNIFLTGFSAGGNLALSTSAYLGPEKIKGVIGFYPSVELTKEYEAPSKTFDSGVIIPKSLRRLFYEAYIPFHVSLSNPRISAAFAPSDSFPKHVLVACGNADVLFTPAELFVDLLKESGHPDAVFVPVENEAHAFDKQAKPESATELRKMKMYDEAVAMIHRAIGA